MVFARHVRLALLGSAALLSLLASPAQATSSSSSSSSSFQFTSCADNCVTASGCQADSAKCMCKQAKGLFLDSVISCMFFNCQDDLRNFQSAFLQPVESGCDANKRAIPTAKIKEAEDVASSYIAMLPSSASPTAAPQTSASPTPATTTTTTTSDKPSSISDQKSSSTSTSASSDGSDDAASTSSSAGPTSSDAGKTTTSAPTQVAAPSTSTTTQAAATTSASSASDDGSDSGGGFNTDPFASPGSSAGSAVQPPSFLSLVLGVPAAVWVLATLR